MVSVYNYFWSVSYMCFGIFFISINVILASWLSVLVHLIRSPSISRSQFRSGLKSHLFRLAFHWLFLRTIVEETELNWIELNWTDCLGKTRLRNDLYAYLFTSQVRLKEKCPDRHTLVYSLTNTWRRHSTPEQFSERNRLVTVFVLSLIFSVCIVTAAERQE